MYKTGEEDAADKAAQISLPLLLTSPPPPLLILPLSFSIWDNKI